MNVYERVFPFLASRYDLILHPSPVFPLHSLLKAHLSARAIASEPAAARPPTNLLP